MNTKIETKTQGNARAASYMREHRAAWRSAGFSGTTNMAHELDIMKVQAFTNLTKFERLLSLVNSGDEGSIRLATSRNSPKLPNVGVMQALEDRIEKLVESDYAPAIEAHRLVAAIRGYGRKSVAGRIALEDAVMNDELRARTIVYANLANATFQMAEALISYSPDLGEAE